MPCRAVAWAVRPPPLFATDVDKAIVKAALRQCGAADHKDTFTILMNDILTDQISAMTTSTLSGAATTAACRSL